MDEAEVALQTGQFDHALELAVDEIKAQPDSGRAQLIAAEAELGLGMSDEALARLGDLDLPDEEQQIRRERVVGSCLMNFGRLDDAEEHFETALRATGFDAAMGQSLLRLYQYQGRNWEAQRLAERLIARNVTNSEVRSARQGVDQVLPFSSLQIPAGEAEVQNERATLMHHARELFSQKEYEFAEDYLRKILADEPSLGEAQGRYGQILALTRPNQFRTWHKALPADVGEHPEIWMARATAADQVGDVQAAMRACLNVLALQKAHQIALDWVESQLKRIGHAPRLIAAAQAELRQSGSTDSIANLFDIEFDRSYNWDSIFDKLHLSELTSDGQSAFELVDVADEAGVEFRYDNGSASDNLLGHLVESTGGGAAVFDYDQDGWPDLHLAQGGDWRESHRIETSDAIFRNLEGDHFSNVTAACGVVETGYSQGATAGDFNNDGFPDLYVCNLYGNRMFENNGDGTFNDVTEKSTTAGDEWSVSAAFADLNGDGLSDLYVVNYLDRNEVLEIPCLHDGRPRTCPPTMFSGTDDCCYLNLGDGRFVEIGHLAGLHRDGAKGLGVVIGRLDESQRNSIFVANDTTANFLFRETSEQVGAVPKFEEVGIASGLAFDENGQGQASMGIAAGDANGDGTLDLFTTSFYGEANTLFLQNEGSFRDQSRSANLRDGSFYELGFGTQFFDADLDGDLDLFIANGHIDLTFATGEPDRMLPQLYQNQGDGQFSLVNVGSDFFRQKAFGRAVGLLDWNRDGKQDLAVTHLDRSVALLENRSTTDGNWLALNLIGTRQERDAIGAMVRVTAGGRTQSHYVLSGNGFACANERKLLIGLGNADTVERLEVSWMAGEVEVFEDIQSDQEVICIEGCLELSPIARVRRLK